MKNYFKLLFSFILFLAVSLYFPQSTFAQQQCSGTTYYCDGSSACEETAPGNCHCTKTVASSCYVNSNGSCVGQIINQVCGYTLSTECIDPNSCIASGGTVGQLCLNDAYSRWCTHPGVCKLLGAGGSVEIACGTQPTSILTPTQGDPGPTSTIPGTPTVITPSGTIACPLVDPTPVTFSWTAASSATSYHLRIDDLSNGWIDCGSGPSNPGDYCMSNLQTTTFTVMLPISKNYRWWVSAYNGSTAGALSSVTNFTIPGICPTPTITPVAMCQNVLAYNSNWVLLSNIDLSQTKVGDILNYCVTGYSNIFEGGFDRARFTINGVLQPETTLLRPGTSADYCYKHIVPGGVNYFNIFGEIHHSILGWVS